MRHDGLRHRTTNIVPAQRIVDEFLNNLCPIKRVLNLNDVNCPYSPATVEIDISNLKNMKISGSLVCSLSYCCLFKARVSSR